jgi:hypothetical protein
MNEKKSAEYGWRKPPNPQLHLPRPALRHSETSRLIPSADSQRAAHHEPQAPGFPTLGSPTLGPVAARGVPPTVTPTNGLEQISAIRQLAVFRWVTSWPVFSQRSVIVIDGGKRRLMTSPETALRRRLWTSNGGPACSRRHRVTASEMRRLTASCPTRVGEAILAESGIELT